MRRPALNSFSAKLVALVLACVCLPLLILGAYGALKLQQTNENDFRSALQTLATQNAQEVDRWLAERTRRVEELSGNSVINDGLLSLAGLEPRSDAFFLVQYRLTKYLEVLKSSIPSAIYIGLYDASGRLRIAADSPAARMAPPLTADERRALAGGAVILSTPSLQKLDPVFYDIPDTDEVPAMRFSAPVSRDDEVLGFVSVTVDLNSMSESILFYNERIASVGFKSLDIYMIDANGVFLTASAFQDSLRSIGRIAHSGALELDLQVPDTENFTEAFNGIRARFAEGGDAPTYNMAPYPDYRGIPVVGAWAPLEAKDWYVIAEIDGDEFEIPVRQAVSNLVLVVSVILVCVSLLVWVFTRRLLQPLQVLRDAAQGFASGDRRVRCNIDRADEIGLLAASFDRMVDAVDKSLTDLQEQVAERQRAEEGMRQARNRSEENARSLAEAKEAADLANQSKSHLLANLPTQIIMADPDLRITYVNPAMQAGLEKVRDAIKVPAERVLDTPLDELHPELAYVSRFRTRPDGLPHSHQATIGGEVVDLLVSASFDQDGAYLGPMLTWDFVTEQVRLGEEKRRASQRERAQARELQEKVDGMLAVVQAAGAGDLTRRVGIGGGDAIGQMGEGLEFFLGQLRRSIGEIGASTRILADASKELTENSRQMETNAGTTSEQAETVSTNARTVSDSLQTVADAVEQTAASIDAIMDSANRAAAMAQRAVAMTAGANETIGLLGENSKEIGGVIRLITSIAEQTNLLALNATIEAARAGEAGKGFAVVANEVKELARETAEATGVVGERIAAIQANTDKATAAISEVSAIIAQIDALQAGIAGSVQEQHATSGEIAANITRAANSGVNISQSIEGVAQSAQTALARVGETRNAADSLTRLAADLEALVQKFVVAAPPDRPDLDRLRDKLAARASA